MRKHLFSLALLLGVAPASLACAQSAASDFARNRNVSVRERPRPGYDAIGVHLGTFLLRPRAELSETIDDNIFFTNTGTVSDSITSFAPSATLSSDWSVHSLSFTAKGLAQAFGKRSNENSVTGLFQADGRIDVLRSTNITATARIQHDVEGRYAADSPTAAAKPVRYDTGYVLLGGVHELGRVRLSANADYKSLTYDDVKTVSGVTLDQGYRDEHVTTQSVRGDYAVSPALAVFLTGSHNEHSFKRTASPADVGRNSDGYEGDVGADFDVTRLVRGNVQIGYLKQNYSDARVSDTSGLAVHGRVNYFPTQLLTLTFNADRAIQDTGLFGAGGMLSTDFGVTGDYEALRNLIVTGKVLWDSDDYKGLSRTDDNWTAGLSAAYLVSRTLGLNASYTHQSRSSSGAQRGTDFDDNQFVLGLVVQY